MLHSRRQLVLDWCTRHGLLGLLPVLATCVQLPGQITKERDAVRIDWPQYFRQGGRWDTHTDSTREAIFEEADRGKAANTARLEVEGEDADDDVDHVDFRGTA